MKNIDNFAKTQAERLMIIIRQNPRGLSEDELVQVVADILKDQIYEKGVLTGRLEGLASIERFIAKESEYPKSTLDKYDEWLNEKSKKKENSNVSA